MNRVEISNLTAISFKAKETSFIAISCKAKKTTSCNPTLLLNGLIF
jgi:hypothetical protein